MAYLRQLIGRSRYDIQFQVFKDLTSGDARICCQCLQIQDCSRRTVAVLDHPVSAEQAFQDAFLTPRPPPALFDYVWAVDLPGPASSPADAAADFASWRCADPPPLPPHPVHTHTPHAHLTKFAYILMHQENVPNVPWETNSNTASVHLDENWSIVLGFNPEFRIHVGIVLSSSSPCLRFCDGVEFFCHFSYHFIGFTSIGHHKYESMTLT